MDFKEEVFKALENVKDPEIGASITRLNMIKDVEVKNGFVRVMISLTIAACPLTNVIEEDIKREVKKLPWVKDVVVDFTYMNEEERRKFAEKISGSEAEKTVRKTWLELGSKLPKFNFKKIVAIVSGKGGVGKSSVTSLIASELRRRKFEVGILDADLTGSSIAHAFGIEGERIYSTNPIPPESKTGIKIISINFLLENPEVPIMWRGPLLTNALVQLYRDINWGKLDFLLLDMPPGSSDIPLTVFQFLPIDGIIMVTTPQEISAKVVSKTVNMALAMKVKIYGIIENMSYLICENCGNEIKLSSNSSTESIAKKFKLEILGRLPIDKKLAELFDEGKIENYKNEEIVKIVDKILNFS